MRLGAAARLGHRRNGQQDCKNFQQRLQQWGQRSAPAHLRKTTRIFEKVDGTSCNRRAAATAQIKQSRKCTQVEDSQQHCVWWRKLTAAGLYRLARRCAETMPSLVAPLRPRRPRPYPEAASVAVWFWLCVGSLLRVSCGRELGRVPIQRKYRPGD